jgi:basic amino acid/polyamine antiporter, APA family
MKWNRENQMSQETPQLRRELGLWDAIAMGLGSIIGTGVFVSIGIVVGIAGAGVIGGIAIAAVVAICNGLSAAQLAANHPVSGGTYEYGYRYLNPDVGFVAGWLFLLAKSASAATAALGFAGYLLSAFQIARSDLIIPIALIAVIVLTILVLEGIQKSNRINTVIVGITLFSLLFFVFAGLPKVNASNFVLSGSESLGIFHAAALMFVSYTGYGRITTMGEEVQNPQKTIPTAIIVTLILTMLLYLAISVVGIGVAGVDLFSLSANSKAAPLEVVARYFTVPGSSQVLAIGAVTAMLGVLLNLILGLSRVLLAMGRRGDMPRIVARLNATQTSPTVAVIVVGSAIALLVLIGNVKTTWSFSAFTVLVYYALTNLASLRLSTTERLYPRWISGLGLVSCAFLAFWVEPAIWLTGLGLIGVGLGWKRLVAR